MPSAYARDLAEIHDAGYAEFSATAAPGLLRRLRRAGIGSGLVVDLGCGSGIWARALTDAGYDVLGVDPSAAMLRIARRRARGAPGGRARTAGTSFREGDGWVLCNEITAGADTLTRRITTFTRSGRTWRRADEEHVLRLFEPAEVVAELHRAGYDAQRLRSYGSEQRSLTGLAFFAATRRDERAARVRPRARRGARRSA